MGWRLAVDLLRYGLLLWLGMLAVAIVYRLLDGRVNVAGLLAQDPASGQKGDTSPERMQFIVGIALAAFVYITQVLSAMHGAKPLTALPEVPQNLLLLFAGSHVVYLSGKLARMIRS